MKKNQIKTTLFGIFIAFIIIAVGMLVISSVISSISTTNMNSQMNTTVSNTNTVYNIGGLFLLLLVPLVILGSLVYFSSTFERYNNITKVLNFLGQSLYYFVFGLVAILIIVVPGYLIYLLYNVATTPGNIAATYNTLKWIGIFTLLFFGISVLGYFFKTKILNKFQKHKQTKEYEKNQKELPGVVS